MKPQDIKDLTELIELLKQHQVAEFDFDGGDQKIRLKFNQPAAPAAELHIVKSPIVGTYYGSPSPGASAFVAPGDRVEKGQVICIVEAMKLMNEIESDASGEIVKCLVTNGQPIEFGQPLFSIRAS